MHAGVTPVPRASETPRGAIERGAVIEWLAAYAGDHHDVLCMATAMPPAAGSVDQHVGDRVDDVNDVVGRHSHP
jgi:hypothetical protein